MKLKIAFGTIMLVSILALSAMAQYSQPGYGQYPARVYGQGQGRLSPEDQRDFDKYYAKWVDDTRKNDQDDIGKDTRHMQEIMAGIRVARIRMAIIRAGKGGFRQRNSVNSTKITRNG